MVLWGCPRPRGYLSVSSVPPEEHGVEKLVPVHLPHKAEGLISQTVRDCAPVPVPRAGPPLPLAPAPPDAPVPAALMPRPAPPPAEAIRAGSPLGAGGGLAGAGSML